MRMVSRTSPFTDLVLNLCTGLGLIIVLEFSLLGVASLITLPFCTFGD
jgi:hypothetical protein